MPTILDGRKTREALTPELVKRIKALPFTPTLAIIQVGGRPDSTVFINTKKKFAEKIGVRIEYIHFPESVSEAELIGKIKDLNTHDAIHGIIVQLPLPANLNKDRVIGSIDPRKDADALTSPASKRMPATARGIRELLKHYGITLKGKKVTVIGRSTLVGTPVANMAREEGATVTVGHSKTPDLVRETLPADIVIVAVGKPKLIGIRHVKEGQVIIDVGITRDGTDALSGDVDFEKIRNVAAAISPVPGGVGPMTVFALFENLVDLCENTVN